MIIVEWIIKEYLHVKDQDVIGVILIFVVDAICLFINNKINNKM